MKFLSVLFYWTGVVLMGVFAVFAIVIALTGCLVGYLIGRCKYACVRRVGLLS